MSSADLDAKILALQERIRDEPRNVDVINDLGAMLARARRLDDALPLFKTAVDIDPERKVAWWNLATAYTDLNQLEAAESALLQLTVLDPSAPKSFKELGRIRRKLKRFPLAVDPLLRAIELSPSDAEAFLELGMTYADLKREEDAKQAYRKALEAQPESANAHNNLGVLLKDQGDLENAEKHLREAVRLRPNAPSDHNNLGVLLAEMGNHEEAIKSYKRALELDNNYLLAWNNLGNAQRVLGDVSDAIRSLQNALRLKPDYAEASNNLAIAFLQSGDPDKAVEAYNRAILLKPDYAEARMNRALVWLGLGDLERGWSEYEWRWHLRNLRMRPFPGRRWDGSPLNGKRILIRYEQGLGDTLQFIRYMPMLKHRGAYVIFEGQAAVRQLFSRLPGIDEFVPRGEALPPYDFYTTLLSLPGYFETTLNNVPVPIPYIFADEGMVKAWEPRLSALGGFKVGIAWQGNPQHRGDRQRSVPLEQFRVLSEVEGVKLVSLQRGFGSEQIQQLMHKFDLETFEGIDEQADGFLRTAAILKNLDLVITVDTAVAHLAGAMGIPVWVALPLAADWRWLRDREDSPWYPSMRLFRRMPTHDWASVFQTIRGALVKRVAETRLADSPPSSSDPAKATELLREGNRLIVEGDLAKAQAAIEQAVFADPLNPNVHHDLGVALAKQGRVREAIDAFRRCLELKPDSSLAFANIGLAFLQSDRIDESIAHLRKAIHLGGGSAEVYNNLGIQRGRS